MKSCVKAVVSFDWSFCVVFCCASLVFLFFFPQLLGQSWFYCFVLGLCGGVAQLASVKVLVLSS